jgi:sulfur relay (sulfurtransferase) DsrC/TusE family protein
LTENHWKVINYLRDYSKQYELHLWLETLQGNWLSIKGNLRYVSFGPAKELAKLPV